MFNNVPVHISWRFAIQFVRSYEKLDISPRVNDGGKSNNYVTLQVTAER